MSINLDERYQVLPAMPPDQFNALKADIAERGVLVPLDVTEDGFILDGHHRYRACRELGIEDFPTIVRPGLGEEDRRLFARNNNMLRRHLSRKQVRELIEAQLRDTPSWANSRIGQALGVDKKTVQAARRRLEATGEIPRLTELVGADGKQRKATRPAAIMASTADELRQILQRCGELDVGTIDTMLAGFASTVEFMTIHAPDPFDALPEAAQREWIIAMIHGIHPDRVSWCLRQDFATPTEWFSPEGQAYMARIGCGAKRDPEPRWRETLQAHEGQSLAELGQRLADTQAGVRR